MLWENVLFLIWICLKMQCFCASDEMSFLDVFIVEFSKSCLFCILTDGKFSAVYGRIKSWIICFCCCADIWCFCRWNKKTVWILSSDMIISIPFGLRWISLGILCLTVGWVMGAVIGYSVIRSVRPSLTPSTVIVSWLCAGLAVFDGLRLLQNECDQFFQQFSGRCTCVVKAFGTCVHLSYFGYYLYCFTSRIVAHCGDIITCCPWWF